jgi:hypothetical protein
MTFPLFSETLPADELLDQADEMQARRRLAHLAPELAFTPRVAAWQWLLHRYEGDELADLLVSLTHWADEDDRPDWQTRAEAFIVRAALEHPDRTVYYGENGSGPAPSRRDTE